jgi:hypothetical protein
MDQSAGRATFSVDRRIDVRFTPESGHTIGHEAVAVALPDRHQTANEHSWPLI